jgi:tRNA-2-methylthio-N6-dimethylallyladenosine synthase
LALLQEKQREIQTARHLTMVGETFELLVSGKSRRENQWSGHTPCHRVINFASQEQALLGKYVQVRVTGATPNSLAGEQALCLGEPHLNGLRARTF